MKEDKRKEQLGNPLAISDPKNTFEKIAMYPKALNELKTHELEMARDQGLAWLKEIDRLHNDALDTIERNHKRLGLTPIADGDDLELPSGAGADYAQALQWHKKAKEQAVNTISAIQEILGGKPIFKKKSTGTGKPGRKADYDKTPAIEYWESNKNTLVRMWYQTGGKSAVAREIILNVYPKGAKPSISAITAWIKKHQNSAKRDK